MSTAPQVPVFPPDGVPVSVLIDFDGTISLDDVGDALLTRLVEDQAAVRRMDQLYIEHRKGSRELIAWDMEVLPRDPAVLLAAVDAIDLDETFRDLVATVTRHGAAIEIVSDGMGFHVERMLARLRLADLPVATNATTLGEGAAGVAFPFGHPACLVCGTCKRERVRRHQAAGRVVVFVGDGPSDRYAAHHADVIFAKWSLAAWCQAQGAPYEAWDRLGDVAAWLEGAFGRGGLPTHAAAVDAWVARRATPRRPFICGPEVWGPGRSVAVDDLA
jgi:2-hydroxy-3-keto-5-methylthiopentenyl-1-phosphate phosphatase